jgi:hypothetical protein
MELTLTEAAFYAAAFVAAGMAGYTLPLPRLVNDTVDRWLKIFRPSDRA